MKNKIRITAAALAAITAVSCASLPTFADTDTVIGEDVYTDMITGGWSVNTGYVSMSKNPEAKAAFKKATAGLAGVNYHAVAVLGTQVVAGTNYCILCRSTVVYPDAQPEIKLMYIYEDLQGNAEITGFKTIIGEQLAGGFTANSGKLGVSKNPRAYKAYKKAMKGLVGVSYTPFSYLGSQVVAGTNHLFFCRSKVTAPDASPSFSLVTVYEDLKGKASLLNVENIVLGETDHDAEGNKVFILSVEEGTTDEQMREVFKKFDLDVVYDYENFNMYAVSVSEPLDDAQSKKFISELLEAYSFILSAEPDSVMYLMGE